MRRWKSSSRFAFVVAGLAALVCVGTFQAQPANGPDTKAIDKAVYESLRDVINRGADLFNFQADYAGCYRVYQGALIGLKPLLSHHQQLQKDIDTGLIQAERMPRIVDRAFALRKVIDQVRAQTNPNPPKEKVTKKPVEPAPKSLWDNLGGEANVRKVVDDFVAAAAADPKVNFTRNGKYKLDAKDVDALKQKLVEFVSAASGGPLKYTGRSMKEVHKGMAITDDEFDAAAVHLIAALEKNKARAEDINAVLKAVGGTRGDIVEAKPQAKTLWDNLGGEANVRKVIDDFVAAAAPDPKVNFDRNGKYKLDAKDIDALKQKLVEFVSMASGGPFKYTGKSMKEAHKGMAITDAEFDAAAAHLKAALEKNGAKKEDVDAVLKAVGGTRGDIVEAKPQAKTLWDNLGGEANVRKVIDDFVAAAAPDPKVNFDRNGKYKFDAKDIDALKQKLVEFVSMATGGPFKYTGKTMKEAHKGMAITDDEFDAAAAHLIAALEKNKARAEDINAVLKAVEGTRKDIVEAKAQVKLPQNLIITEAAFTDIKDAEGSKDVKGFGTIKIKRENTNDEVSIAVSSADLKDFKVVNDKIKAKEEETTIEITIGNLAKDHFGTHKIDIVVSAKNVKSKPYVASLTIKELGKPNNQAKTPPTQLDPAVVDAWKKAGGELLWMGPWDAVPVFFTQDPGELRHAVPGFSFKDLKDVDFTKLPIPQQPFGLSGNLFTQEQVQQLGRFPTLHFLSLQLAFDEKDCPALQDLSELRGLKLFQFFGGEGILKDRISRLKKLKFLDIGFNQLGDKALEDLPPTLESLGLGLLDVSDAGLKHLSALKNLKSLAFYDNKKIGRPGLKTIAGLSSLEYLGLTGLGIQDEDLVGIGQLLELKSLALENGDVTDDGIKSLLKLGKLKGLILSETKVTDVGVQELAALPDLEVLFLDRTKVTGKGLAALKKLKVLSLTETGVNDAGLKEIGVLQNLDNLVLIKTPISDKGFAELNGLKKLRFINLVQTKISNPALDQMVKSIPGIQIVPPN